MLLDEIRDLEHQGWRSLCNSTGADFYGRIMTSDGLMLLAGGQVFNRQDVIDSLNQAPPWRGYEISDERLIPLGEGQVIFVYTGRAYRESEDSAFTAVMSSTYTRREGAWRLALYQQTPVA
ncbi:MULTISPECIES: nuclear transport factor 2 family protein [Streptomyces]|uniref:nuclear transport factor 2 family protein n=1 Tax=Streptomyces TaxID=1883 RepID=UPI0022AA6E55|nr:nuclear transport factor 2 family protein [Streptomyces sp. HB2AG]MCZ2523132.1 nuclear transport factor 2 family protein [Streptomyces sp. HB2AG]